MKLFGKELAFYNGQIKKYTALFGSLFSELYIRRSETEYVKVPIRYANGTIRNKGNNGDIGDEVRVGTNLPAMAFELASVGPDPGRRTNQYTPLMARTTNDENYTTINYSMNQVPHNLVYVLTVRTKTLDDAFQILEQIVSTFNPSVSVELIDNDNLNLVRDIQIKLEESPYDILDNYADTQDETRMIEISLQFTLSGYLYKRTEVGSLVLHAIVVGTVDGEEFKFLEDQATPEDIQTINDNAAIGNAHRGFGEFAKGISKE